MSAEPISVDDQQGGDQPVTTPPGGEGQPPSPAPTGGPGPAETPPEPPGDPQPPAAAEPPDWVNNLLDGMREPLGQPDEDYDTYQRRQAPPEQRYYEPPPAEDSKPLAPPTAEMWNDKPGEAAVAFQNFMLSKLDPVNERFEEIGSSLNEIHEQDQKQYDAMVDRSYAMAKRAIRDHATFAGKSENFNNHPELQQAYWDQLGSIYADAINRAAMDNDFRAMDRAFDESTARRVLAMCESDLGIAGTNWGAVRVRGAEESTGGKRQEHGGGIQPSAAEKAYLDKMGMSVADWQKAMKEYGREEEL